MLELVLFCTDLETKSTMQVPDHASTPLEACLALQSAKATHERLNVSCTLQFRDGKKLNCNKIMKEGT